MPGCGDGSLPNTLPCETSSSGMLDAYWVSGRVSGANGSWTPAWDSSLCHESEASWGSVGRLVPWAQEGMLHRGRWGTEQKTGVP